MVFGHAPARTAYFFEFGCRYIAQANREKLGLRGTEKIVTFDQGQSGDGFVPGREANNVRTRGLERKGGNFPG
jgi:hypothetical protein